MTRRFHSEPPPSTLETPEERRRRQDQVTTSQLATPRPDVETNRAASVLTPIALIVMLAVVAGALVWILLYPRQQTTYGSVSSFDGNVLAVETLDGPVEHFALDAETVQPPALTPGDAVVVHYRESDGSKVATEIAPHERAEELAPPQP